MTVFTLDWKASCIVSGFCCAVILWLMTGVACSGYRTETAIGVAVGTAYTCMSAFQWKGREVMLVVSVVEGVCSMTNCAVFIEAAVNMVG